MNYTVALFATINSIGYAGNIPAFIDTEWYNWNIDMIIETYPDIKVIVLVSLYGTQEIEWISDKHSALIVEDAVESFGAKCKLNDQWV